MHFAKTAILGVGLIGASFALSLRKEGLCSNIAGFGRNEAHLGRALERGIIDSCSRNAANVAADADLIVFATPVGFFTTLAETIRAALRPGVVVTDVGSVKGRLVYDLEGIVASQGTFIGAHPIAGSEQSGIEAAHADLFRGSRCIVTPTEKSDAAALATVVELWRTLGSEVVTMSPEQHDRVFGAVSHLPHIIAYEVMNTIADLDQSYLDYAGRGLKDSTRIAASSPEIWRDICMLNRENLDQFLSVFIERLEKMRQGIARSEGVYLEQVFARAQALRERLGQD